MLDSTVINGKSVPFERSRVEVSKCELDHRNPRIQYMIGLRGSGITETEVDELLWGKDAVKALAQQILQNGGVYDPVLVQRSGDKFRVREGNSRTVSCRHLVEQFPGDSRFMTMPAMIFDVDLTEEDLAVLLADMHVAKKISWDAYEQAKHIADLYNVYGKTQDWLATHLRLSKSKVVELLATYGATTDFLIAHPGPENVKKFTFFQEVFRKKELRLRYLDDLDFKQKLNRWLVDGKITDSRQIRDLPLILTNVEAMKALEGGGIDEANKVLIQDDPSLNSDLFFAIKTATEKLRKAPADDIQDLKTGNAQKVIMLRNLHRSIQDLATLAGVTL